MNFYFIKIGTRSRHGTLIENVSFVCKAETDRAHEVQQHFQKQYSGFDVSVDTINEVKGIETAKKSAVPVDSEKILALNDRIRELETQLCKKDEEKERKISVYQGLIRKVNYPKELIDLIPEIMETNKKLYDLRNSAESIIKEYIRSNNKDRVSSVWRRDGFSSEYNTYSYNAELKGKIIINKLPED